MPSLKQRRMIHSRARERVPAAVADASHYWRLSSGTDLADWRGSATLTKVGTITTMTGKVGATAAVMAGSGLAHYFTAANQASLGWTADRTFAGWIYYTGVDLTDTFNAFFCKGAGEKPCLSILQTPFNIIRLQAGAVDKITMPKPTNDAWHFVVLTFTLSTTTMVLRIDDAAVANGTTAGIPDLTDAGTFYIGADLNANNWVGGLEQFGIWPSVLSADDQTYLYNSGAGRQVF